MFKNLKKNTLTLEILQERDLISLTELASEQKIWEYAPYPFYIQDIFRKKWFEKAMQQMQEGSRIAFIISQDEKIVGSSSYYDIDYENKKMKLGYTWFHTNYWGTTINAQSKIILLEHAFETMKFNRVCFSVDSVNGRSCRALEKLGIKKEGILRNDMILPNQRLRHSVIFSVIAGEWIDVKKQIQHIVKTL